MGSQLTQKLMTRSNGTFVASIVAIICFFIGIAVTAHVGLLVRNELLQQHMQKVRAELSEARARLEREISRTVAHGVGLRSYVVQFSDTTFEAFSYLNIATELLNANSAIRSIGLAPDNVVKAVYPMEPNRAAIGLDYRSNAAQWPAVEQAMRTREVVIAGPVDLVQGGHALMIRVPVFPADFTGQPMAERRYWGMATLVVDQEKLLALSGIAPEMDGRQVALVDKGPDGTGTRLVFGDRSLQGVDAVSLPLLLPGGLNWALQGYPDGGWSSTGRGVWITQFVGSLISLIFGVMAFLLISEVYKVRSMALHDPLTGLANRRLLQERMMQLATMCERSGAGFEIFYVDLDAFKPVNDSYGHSVGDQLLVEIGERLRLHTRQSDTVARVGGDEFIVLTPGNMRRQEKETFVSRLSEGVTQAFEFSGTSIDIRASIGSASYPIDAANVEDLLRVADNRMYAQKAKNKAVAAKSAPQAS